MPTYQVWDLESGGMLLETKRWRELQQCMEELVDVYGEDILDTVKVLELHYRQPPRTYAVTEVLINILGIDE